MLVRKAESNEQATTDNDGQRTETSCKSCEGSNHVMPRFANERRESLKETAEERRLSVKRIS
jgi:hypothetical protein